MMNKRIVAIIPARGGSKGLKKKNIHLLANKPLIEYSIEAAIKSKYIDEVVVTSDDDTIIAIAQKHAISIIKRPSFLAQDNTNTASVVSHVLDNLSQGYDILILLQPTSPLRDEKDIDSAIENFMSKDADALISVREPKHSPFKAFTCNTDGFLEGIVNNKYPFMPRQELPVAYYPNGAIYIIKVQEFIKNKTFFCQKTIPFYMNEIKSIDIDTYEDLIKIEKILLG